MYFSCVGDFLYYDARMETPKYEFQRHKGLCPILNKIIRWEARIHPDGDLRWFCSHGPIRVEKAVSQRKKSVKI